jgi:hypothetical protein
MESDSVTVSLFTTDEVDSHRNRNDHVGKRREGKPQNDHHLEFLEFNEVGDDGTRHSGGKAGDWQTVSLLLITSQKLRTELHA